MCGLTGLLDFSRAITEEQATRVATRMAASLIHRGPDDAGVWVDAPAGLALAHRRLTIIDPSPAGHQPMLSDSGRFVITFNGEIYNYLELRAELLALGARLKSRSDTEIILAAAEQWGVEASLRKFNGMFAIALWDRRDRCLYLMRDRFGEKPLYYGMAGSSLVFGSELKALRAHPEFEAHVDMAALTQYVQLGYVGAPRAIIAGVRKLPPATYLRVSHREHVDSTPIAYWSVEEVAAAGLRAPFGGTFEEATEQLDALLRRSVRNRMLADVPLGAFLSGGIDSSTIVALMQKESTAKVKTFTIGMHEQGFNEAELAAAVARHLGTEHTELYVTSREVQGVIPNLPLLYDEPFADMSQVPTFLVSQLARRSVTVALSGDGGDELFGGYNRYFWASKIWRRVGRVHPVLRTLLKRSILLLGPSEWDAVIKRLSPLVPPASRRHLRGDRLHKLAGIVSAGDSDTLYGRLISQGISTSALLSRRVAIHSEEVATRLPNGFQDLTDRMMLADTLAYLPDDILVKVDRAAMGVSLETRVPMLDPRVAEFAWSLPRSMKVRGDQGKLVLRSVLARHLPRAMFERPKMGFGIPLNQWLRGPLREWADAALSPERLRSHGLFDVEPVRRKWQEHLSGVRDWQYALWTILMFQCWEEHWRAPLTIAEPPNRPSTPAAA